MTRPALRVVARPEPELPVAFCGYCAERPDPGVSERICGSCGLGVVLQADAGLAPAPGTPFLVVDQALCVCAVSEAAEALLSVGEPDAVNRHVAELIVPAAAESRGPANLLDLVVSAARGDVPVHTAVVRPADLFGVRYLARVGACGPPLAALVVLADDDV